MSHKSRILIVDDEVGVQESFRMIFSQHYDVSVSSSGEDACDKIKKNAPDLMILDIVLPGMKGIEVLKKSQEISSETLVIVVTADESQQTAIDAMKHGAYDYIQKPFDVEELRLRVGRAIKEKKHQDNMIDSGYEITTQDRFDRIIGRSEKIQKVFNTLSKLVHSNATVLTTGESGTGKELVARALHYNGSRRNDPFVVIQTTAIPPDLLESELFGHEKGAFTGAIQRKRGMLEIANGGTLFLDEIGDMPFELQSKLLRVIQERQFRRVGGEEEIKVDVRFIAASNTDLKKAVKEGHFREDLYYRLNVVSIELPALRERKDDIPLLVQHFHKRLKESIDTPVESFSKDAMDAFMKYDWPGNIRELHNVLESLMVMIDEKTIQIENLPKYLRSQEFLQGSRVNGSDSLEQAVRLFEKQIIEDALRKSRGILTRAANVLGTTRRKIKYRIDYLEIDVHRFKSRKTNSDFKAKA